MSILLDTADAIVTVLNTASGDSTLSQSFTATRKYVPRVTLEALSTLHVTVAPASTRGMVVTRGLNKQQYFSIEVGIQKRSTEDDPADDNDTFDPLVTLAEEMDTLLVGQQFTVGALTLIGSTRIGGEENHEERDYTRPVCDPILLADKRVFESISRFSFKVVTT